MNDTDNTVTRDEVLRRANAHLATTAIDRGYTRTLTGKHYHQAVAICRAKGLATEDELRGARHNRTRVTA